MSILILGANGFIGKNVSKHFMESTKVDSSFHNFLTGPGYDKFDSHDVIIDCVGKYGGLPYNQKYQEEVYFENTLINVNIKKLIKRLAPTRYIKIYGACMYPSVEYDVQEEILQNHYTFADSVKWSALPQLNDLRYLKQSTIPHDALVVTNCYGLGDHYGHERSHVIGSVLTKMSSNNEQINCIGTGISTRDFLYVDDLGSIIKKLLNFAPTNETINVSTGDQITISKMIEKIAKNYGYTGKILWGDANDNGVVHKGMDNKKLLNLIGDFKFTSFDLGISKVVEDFKQTQL
tara:strand:+ start:1594 stop:2466 length:873 start_codon:yes stop_codon:yes gene_type:complete